MSSSTKYSPEIREHAVRMVLEHQSAQDSQTPGLHTRGYSVDNLENEWLVLMADCTRQSP